MNKPIKHSDKQLGAISIKTDQQDLLSLYLLRFDRENTRVAYRNDLEHFFGASYIDLDWALQVSFITVNEYIANLEDDGFKPSTLKRRIAAIRGFFDWLMALGMIEQNPAHRQLLRRVRSVRHSEQGIVFLSSAQAEALLDGTKLAGKAEVRDRTLILTLLYCVLRRSEAASMDAEHIRPLGHYWILDLPRTKGGSDQYVKIPAHVVEQIDEMKAHYGIQEGPLWRSLSNNNYGGRLAPQSIYEIVKKTALRAGLSETVGAHTLRHTGCTLALEAGATLQQVQTHARHKNIETTMAYLHQRDKLRDSAADYIRVNNSKLNLQ